MTDNSDERGPRAPREPFRTSGQDRGGDRPMSRPGSGGKGRPSRPPTGPARDRFAARWPEDASAPEPDMVADDEARLLPAEERIAKVIARAGIASRRDAEAMIEAGRVTLNGAPVASPALNVGPSDRITVDGEPLPLRERTRLWLFHKPRGLVTTFRDPQGRPTVFEALPEDMPRVVAIGRLDMNTEGLLLLTNDGGLAKVIAQPETGWTRRYRVRAFGDVAQAALDKLRAGITIDGIEYGPVEATVDRVQGDNTWLSLALREGKNREVKRILEHLGLQVNRLIRLSFGPFQLGELESGLVEEIRTKVLKEQLGPTLAAEAEVDWDSPVRTPIAAFGSDRKQARGEREPRVPSPRRAGGPDREPGRGRFERPGPSRRDDTEGRAPRRDRPEGKRPPVWRDGDDRPARPKRFEPREDPRADRAVSAERPRSRMPAIHKEGGKRVLVERIAAPREARDDAPRHRRDGGARFERPERAEREPMGRAPRGPGKPSFGGGGAFGGRPAGGKPGPGGRFDKGKPGPGGRFDKAGSAPGGRFDKGKPFPGKRPFGAGRSERPGGGGRGGPRSHGR